MKTRQKKTAYCFLLVAILLLTVGILGVGNTWSSYWNKASWNTVIHPKQPVISNCLSADGQEILLGELKEESQIEVWFESPVEETAVLSLEFLDPSQADYLEAYLLEEELALIEGRTCGYMKLIPTQLALDLEEAEEVALRMMLETRDEVLFGIFRLTLPAKEKEYPVPGGGGSSGTEVGAGKTKVLTFTFKDVFNVDGLFTVVDPDAIASQYTISVAEAGATDAVVEEDRLWAIPSAEPVSTNVKIAVEVTLKEDAEPGKECTVSFDGIYGDGNGEPGNEKEVYRSVTLTVRRPRANTVSSPPEPEEPEVIGDFAVSALDSFSLEGSLPINMSLPENATMLTLSLDGDDGLPACTRYSVDGGESWCVQYYGGDIRVDTARMAEFAEGQYLLLDLSCTDWDSTQPMHLIVAADTEEGRYTGEVVSAATAELFQSRTAQTPLVMSIFDSLELPVPESWAQCDKEVTLQYLELRDELPEYSEVADDSIRLEFAEDHLTMCAGDMLPSAGTYCLTIGYQFGGVCFAQSEITFFVNYSA